MWSLYIYTRKWGFILLTPFMEYCCGRGGMPTNRADLHETSTSVVVLTADNSRTEKQTASRMQSRRPRLFTPCLRVLRAFALKPNSRKAPHSSHGVPYIIKTTHLPASTSHSTALSKIVRRSKSVARQVARSNEETRGRGDRETRGNTKRALSLSPSLSTLG